MHQDIDNQSHQTDIHQGQHLGVEPTYSNGQRFIFPLAEGETLPKASNPEAVRLFSRLGEFATENLATKEVNQALEEELRTDSLTGISNRRAFKEELNSRIEAATGNDDFALMFIDLDKFKEVNDTLGHDTGDDLLIKVANRLQINLRDGEFIARLGGDEFVAIIDPKITSNDRRDPTLKPEDVIDGLKARLTGEVSTVAEQLGAPFVGASIGVAFYQEGESAKDLLSRADAEMYRVKQEKGANR